MDDADDELNSFHDDSGIEGHAEHSPIETPIQNTTSPPRTDRPSPVVSLWARFHQKFVGQGRSSVRSDPFLNDSSLAENSVGDVYSSPEIRPSTDDGIDEVAPEVITQVLAELSEIEETSINSGETCNPESATRETATTKTPIGWRDRAERATAAGRYAVSQGIITAIRQIASERDRERVIQWFVGALEILRSGESLPRIAAKLYATIDSAELAGLLIRTVGTSIRSYQSLRMPLAMKVAIPVAVAGSAVLGAKGAGIAAFGNAIGLPVVALLFLGTAGVTSVIEAFVRDRGVRDPLTILLMNFIAFESSRRAQKELLEALRADAMTPQRAHVSNVASEILAELYSLDPVQFERHVMSFFEQFGHPTGMTPRSNDFGVDGYVFHPDGMVVVQCKRYREDCPVGRPAIQQLKGVIEEQQAFRGYLVTTSRFTDEARESASKSTRLILIDGQDLVRWHLQPPPVIPGMS